MITEAKNICPTHFQAHYFHGDAPDKATAITTRYKPQCDYGSCEDEARFECEWYIPELIDEPTLTDYERNQP